MLFFCFLFPGSRVIIPLLRFDDLDNPVALWLDLLRLGLNLCGLLCRVLRWLLTNLVGFLLRFHVSNLVLLLLSGVIGIIDGRAHALSGLGQLLHFGGAKEGRKFAADIFIEWCYLVRALAIIISEFPLL